MKVIDEGRTGVTAWWVGQTAKCRDCGRTVQLQRGDGTHIDWVPTFTDREVYIHCRNCDGMMRLQRMLCPKAGRVGFDWENDVR